MFDVVLHRPQNGRKSESIKCVCCSCIKGTKAFLTTKIKVKLHWWREGTLFLDITGLLFIQKYRAWSACSSAGILLTSSSILCSTCTSGCFSQQTRKLKLSNFLAFFCLILMCSCLLMSVGIFDDVNTAQHALAHFVRWTDIETCLYLGFLGSVSQLVRGKHCGSI